VGFVENKVALKQIFFPSKHFDFPLQILIPLMQHIHSLLFIYLITTLRKVTEVCKR